MMPDAPLTIALLAFDDPPEPLVGLPTFTWLSIADRAGFVPALADARPALVIVNGDVPEVARWIAPAKSSPATRRIPFVAISHSAQARAAALGAGADHAVAPDEVSAQLIHNSARRDDPERAEQLDCDCREPLPPLAQQGVAQFNAGAFYEQHDSFEALWMQTESPVRDLYRAILQVGVAYYQILRGNPRGARKMLLRSVQWLAVLPDTCQGIDVAALRQDAARVRAALETMPDGADAEFDRSLLQPVRFAEDGH